MWLKWQSAYIASLRPYVQIPVLAPQRILTLKKLVKEIQFLLCNTTFKRKREQIK
jgi:hypothetical protein